jgi:expansin (peptidoglycan-binding protein)
MRKIYLLCSLLVMHCVVFSQVISVNLTNYQACNGATLIPLVIYSGTLPTLSVHFERQGAAGTWFEVNEQPYNVQSTYIVVSPTDVSGPTNYRVRVVDVATFQEWISNGAAVNPATWNVNRGAPFVTLGTRWGTDCSNNGNYISVSINSTAGGRPPYRIEYKPFNQANFLVAGEAYGFFAIMGITPGINYNVRVVDYCGTVTPVQSAMITYAATASLMQDATTCINGKISVGTTGGVAPFEWGIGKVTAEMPTIIPEFSYRSVNTFDTLAPGDYYVSVKDACGNISQPGFIRLGGGFPRFLTTTEIPAGDSCSRNIIVSTILQGAGPFEYGIRYIQQPQSAWTWQSSNTFTNLTQNGVYFIRIKDKCGQISDSAASGFFSFPTPAIDSITHSSLPSCNQTITVYAKGGYAPLEYGINIMNSGPVTWQTSNVFPNLPPEKYQFRVRDRCGRSSPVINDTLFPKELTVYLRADKDSCSATTAFISIDSVTGGLGSYQYAIRNMASPGNTYTPFTTDSLFNGLVPGYYSVWVKGDCFSEKILDSVHVGGTLMTYDYDLQPSTTCSPFLFIHVHNALHPPFTYSFTNGAFKRTVVLNDSFYVHTVLPNGTYTITITDACGNVATTTLPPLEVTTSLIPSISYQVQYLNNCTEANLIVHGAPTGSTYELWFPQGNFIQQTDSVFNTATQSIPSGKYVVEVYKENFCDGNSFFNSDTVSLTLSGTLLTGTVNTSLPDSFCVYYSDSVRMFDYLLDALPGGQWASTAPQGFSAATGTFIPSVAGAGEYEFTYSILDSCGSLHETSIFLTVASEACQIRFLVGDYHASLQPGGCPELFTPGNAWIDFTDNKGSLLFSINPLGQPIGRICGGVRIVDGNGSSLRSTIIGGKTTWFIDRNYYIEAPFINGVPIGVILYFTNEEIDNMLTFLHNNGYPGAAVSDIRILQKSGEGVDLQVTNESAADPSDLNIITPTIYPNANGTGWLMQFEVMHFSEFNPHFTGSSANLPLTLIDFTGNNRQGQIRLQWKTTDENNTSHFDLERSGDGNSFQSIARIKAAGSSASERIYTDDDLQPLTGNNFYRLKMVDLDGKYTYSKTVLVRSTKVPGLKLTPNPARDHLYVSTPENIKAMAIRIYDATGRLLYHERVNGNQLLKVQTGHLRNGWYLLELQTTTGSMREAFLKQ